MRTDIKRINPLTALAAVSAIVLAAVGVSAATGIVTSSRGTEIQLPKELAPAITHPVAKPAARKSAAQPVAQLAVVQSVREVKEPGDAKGVGAVAGGVAGGVLGHTLGKGKGIFTVIGAAGGAVAGHQIEKKVRAQKHWETTVRFNDGTQRTLASADQPAWRAGDRVRMVNGELRAA